MTTLHSDSILSFLSPTTHQRTPTLPAELTLLITDVLEAAGTFLLTNFVLRAQRDGRKTVLVGLSNGFEHYASILKKSGVQLATSRTKGDFKFIDGSSLDIESILRHTTEALDGLEAPLVLVDDLTSFLWSGQPAQSVAKFGLELRRQTSKLAGSLVLLMHGDDLINPLSEDTYLFRRLLQLADFWLQLSPLSSQIRGELQIHRGPALVEDYGVVERSGPTALQYKLEDFGAVFHLKGLGKGFL